VHQPPGLVTRMIVMGHDRSINVGARHQGLHLWLGWMPRQRP